MKKIKIQSTPFNEYTDFYSFGVEPYSKLLDVYYQKSQFLDNAVLTVNAFGSGIPAFHEDGTPVHTVLTIELQELVQQTQQSIRYLFPKD